MNKELDKISKLKPNWDGYGAFVPLAKTIERVHRLLSILKVKPDIIPLPNGTVMLEWHFNGLDVEIEVGLTQAQINIVES